jgi:protein-S-isoprenylcysteine O-methyltransferase Ste14
MASFDASVRPSVARNSASRSPFVSRPNWRRVGSVVSRGALVALFIVFARSNYSHWRSTGQPSGLGATLLEGWAALLFLVRRMPDEISVRPIAWLAAPIGSFAMLFARPTDGGLPHIPCEILQLVGVVIALVSLGTLGRSFGLVAANRGVKTFGPYKFVRHPAYAGYLLGYLGYVAENPSPSNIALLFLSTAFQLVRISEEEKLLSSDSDYQQYRASVCYRLIPRLY